jgi:hypothetical protein
LACGGATIVTINRTAEPKHLRRNAECLATGLDEAIYYPRCLLLHCKLFHFKLLHQSFQHNSIMRSGIILAVASTTSTFALLHELPNARVPLYPRQSKPYCTAVLNPPEGAHQCALDVFFVPSGCTCCPPPTGSWPQIGCQGSDLCSLGPSNMPICCPESNPLCGDDSSNGAGASSSESGDSGTTPPPSSPTTSFGDAGSGTTSDSSNFTPAPNPQSTQNSGSGGSTSTPFSPVAGGRASMFAPNLLTFFILITTLGIMYC